MYCKCDTTIYSVVIVITEGFFLHLLVAAAACLYSAACRPKPHGYSLDLWPAKKRLELSIKCQQTI